MRSIFIILLILFSGCSSLRTSIIEDFTLIESTSSIQDIINKFGKPAKYIN